MIKTQIQCYTNSYTFDGEIIVPSRVLTSNPQEEEFDLSYTPNFTIKLNDAYSYLNDTVELSFSYGNNEYTAYANVINRSAGVTTLQYSYGLTTTYVEPTPVVHTLEFNNSSFSTSRDNYTDTTTQSSRVEVLYDDEQITLSTQMLSGLNHCAFEPIQGHGGYFRAKSGLDVDEYSDTVTVTYEGLTATCTVNVTITDSTPVPQHTLAFDYDGSGCSCDMHGERIDVSNVWNLLYDDNAVDLTGDSTVELTGLTKCSLDAEYDERDPDTGDPIGDPAGYYWFASYDGESSPGTYTENVTATYNGLTASCQVPVTFVEPTVAYLKFGGAVPTTSDEPNDYTDNNTDGYEPNAGFSILFVDENGNNISIDASNYIISTYATDSGDSEFGPIFEWVSWENENYPDEGAVVISSSIYDGDVSDENAHPNGWTLTIETDGYHILLWDPVGGENGEGEAVNSLTIALGAGAVW